ncbi:hypothetical protein BgiBS90_008575, partial [Biomphalaria glabrata]
YESSRKRYCKVISFGSAVTWPGLLTMQYLLRHSAQEFMCVGQIIEKTLEFKETIAKG